MSGSIYGCPPQLTYVKDNAQTLLIDLETDCFWTLRGIDETIWDLISLDYSFDSIVKMLSLVLFISTIEADSLLRTTLCRWKEQGIIRVIAKEDNGQPAHQ